MAPYFKNLSQVLAKLTSKNQLTLPKSVTEPLGPVQYFEVQTKAGQIILTPVRIQRGDALRAKLAELKIDDKTIESALQWVGSSKTMVVKQTRLAAVPTEAAAKPVTKPSSKAKPAVKQSRLQASTTPVAKKNNTAVKKAAAAKKSAAKVVPAKKAVQRKLVTKQSAIKALKPAKLVRALKAVKP